MRKNIYFLTILIGIILGMAINNHFIAEAQAPWFGYQFWGQPYNWSGNTYSWGGFDYGYSGLLGGFSYGNQLSSTWSPQNSYISSVTSYNPFVSFSSPWALDPGFFPAGWGDERLGTGGIYGPIYGTSFNPYQSPPPTTLVVDPSADNVELTPTGAIIKTLSYTGELVEIPYEGPIYFQSPEDNSRYLSYQYRPPFPYNPYLQGEVYMAGQI